jgi:hypothetical protein
MEYLTGPPMFEKLTRAMVGAAGGGWNSGLRRALSLRPNMAGLGSAAVAALGVIRRRRCRLSRRSEPGAWAEQELLWVAGGSVGCLSAQHALEGLRGHWETRHKLFNNLCRVWLYWVRDVSFSEDRLGRGSA